MKFKNLEERRSDGKIAELCKVLFPSGYKIIWISN